METVEEICILFVTKAKEMAAVATTEMMHEAQSASP